ncbi:unnamed protein product [Rhizopus stolonifer]
MTGNSIHKSGILLPSYHGQCRETFGKEKDTSITTSIPPPIDTMYPDVWPVSLQRSDGVKLVIGTQVSNILITSSIRLDTKMKPCIGSKCMSFQLTTTADSMSTKIYLDLTCLKEGLTMLASPQTSCISSSNISISYGKFEASLAHKMHTHSVDPPAPSPSHILATRSVYSRWQITIVVTTLEPASFVPLEFLC